VTARLPRRVKLGGQSWTLQRVHLDDELGIFGRFKDRQSLIELDADQGIDQERNTVTHELLHAVASTARVFDEPDDEERVVSALAPWLLAMLRDNPALVSYLTARDS